MIPVDEGTGGDRVALAAAEAALASSRRGPDYSAVEREQRLGERQASRELAAGEAAAGRALRRGEASAGVFLAFADQASRLANTLIPMAVQQAEKDARAAGRAAGAQMEMPGVDFAFREDGPTPGAPPGMPAGPRPSSPAGGARAASEIQTSSALPASFLAAVDHSEGGGDYDTLFGHAQRAGGAFAGTRVSEMTVGQAIAFASPKGAYAANVRGQVGRTATPMGRHQIVGNTLRRAAAEMGLSPDTPFNKQTQDAVAAHLAKKRIAGARTLDGKISALRSEWEGFRSVPRAQLAQIVADLEGGVTSVITPGGASTGGAAGGGGGRVEVKLTGTLQAPPQMPGGNMMGDAFNAGVAESYTNRAEAAMRGQMEALALDYPDDPQGLSAALDELRAGYTQNLPPEIGNALAQSFDRNALGLTIDAAKRFSARIEAEAKVDFEEAHAARMNTAARLASRAGEGDPAMQQRTADALAAETMAIFDAIDGGPLTVQQKARLKASAQADIVERRVLGEFDNLPDAPSRAAYLAGYEKAWGEGSGIAANIDADAYDRTRSKMVTRINADEVDARQRTAAVDKAIDTEIGYLKKGLPATPATRDMIAAEVAATGNAALAGQLNFLDTLSAWQRAHIGQRPEAVEAQIELTRQRIMTEGANPRSIVTLDVMESLAGEMRKGLAADPLGWAARAGVAKVAPLDVTNAGTLAASLSQRTAQAEAIAAHYGIKPRYFTPAEADALKKSLEQSPLTLPSLASALASGLGDDAPAALAELSKDAPLLAHIGGLVHATGEQRLAVEAGEALEMRRQPGYKSELPTDGKLASAARYFLRDALGGDSQAFGQLVETAAAVLERRAGRRGLSLEDFAEPGAPGRVLFEEILDEAMGARVIDGVKFGGLTFVNDFAVVAPTDIAADSMADMLADMSADDLLFQEGIGTANGVPITIDQLRGGRLVRQADGRYLIATGDVAGGDPGYVPDINGGYFELDMRMLKRTQDRAAMPGLPDTPGMARRRTIQNAPNGGGR